MTEPLDPIVETIKLAEEFAKARESNNILDSHTMIKEMSNRDVDLYITVSHNIRMEELAQEQNEILHNHYNDLIGRNT